MKRLREIAVIIACYNRRVTTLRCLKKLNEAFLPTGYKLTVYLVDDKSTDGTPELVRSEFPKVNIIDGDGDLYWNRGMHLAWKKAMKKKSYDFYLWLNDDVILEKSALVDMIDITEEKPGSIVSGTMLDRPNGDVSYGASNGHGSLLVPDGKMQECLGTFNGNLVLVPQSVVAKIGILDPIFPHAIGDFEYAMRAKKYGVKCFISKNISGICEKNASLPKWCLPEIPLMKRLKSLYSPLGNAHPKYFFIYEKRYFGLLTAIKHYLSIHLRALIPTLWQN